MASSSGEAGLALELSWPGPASNILPTWVLTCGPRLAFVRPRLDSSTQARGAHAVVAGLVPWLVSLAALSSVPAGAQASKPRPPFFPYRNGLPSAWYGHAMATAADGSVWGIGGSIGRPDSTRLIIGSDELLQLDLQERQWYNVTTRGPRPSARLQRYGHAMAAVANGTSVHHEEAPEKSAAALLHPFKALLAVMVSTLLSCCFC